MDWKTVEEEIVQDDRDKWDRKVFGQELHVSENGRLKVADNGLETDYSLSDHAASQMCQKLDIPVKYFRRLPTEMKALVANHDLVRQNGNEFLLRGKADWLRAFLSAEYVAYNNSAIAETVQGELGRSDVTVKSFVLQETNMYLKIVSEEIWDVESGLKAGVMIGNSEVGMSSVSVEPFVFRQPCTNDLIVAQEKSFRQAHIHLTEFELKRRMAEAVSQGFRLASSVLERFLKAREEPIVDPVDVIRKLAQARNLPKKLTDETVSNYLAEPGRNRFGIINAFTRAAQGLAPIQRIDMERFAGTLLEASL